MACDDKLIWGLSMLQHLCTQSVLLTTMRLWRPQELWSLTWGFSSLVISYVISEIFIISVLSLDKKMGHCNIHSNTHSYAARVTGPAVGYLRLWRSSDASNTEWGRHGMAAETARCMPIKAAGYVKGWYKNKRAPCCLCCKWWVASITWAIQLEPLLSEPLGAVATVSIQGYAVRLIREALFATCVSVHGGPVQERLPQIIRRPSEPHRPLNSVFLCETATSVPVCFITFVLTLREFPN